MRQIYQADTRCFAYDILVTEWRTKLSRQIALSQFDCYDSKDYNRCEGVKLNRSIHLLRWILLKGEDNCLWKRTRNC